MDTLLGTLNWCFSPRLGGNLFLSPWYSWRFSSSRFKGFATSSLVSLLFDTVAISFAPVFFPLEPSTPFCHPFFFVDAAPLLSSFQVGIFNSSLGARILLPPAWVTSQQCAEYFGLLSAVRLAIRLGFSSIVLVGDNLASLYSLCSLRGFRGVPASGLAVRKLFNILWQHKFSCYCYWCPSELMPADPLSRLFSFDPLLVSAALSSTMTKVDGIFASLGCLRDIGSFTSPGPPGKAG